MAKSVKIGSLWIELSEDNHLDAHQSEASTIGDEQSEQQPSIEKLNNNVVVNSEADIIIISDKDKEAELIKNTDNLTISENNCNIQISVPPPNVCQVNITSKDSPKVTNNHEEDKPKKMRLLADIFKELDSKKTICHAKKKKSENIIPTIEVEGKMKASDNHEDDDELSLLDKGKGIIDKINEDSDSSSSLNEDKISYASHAQLFPRDPLLFGEGASKFFEDDDIDDEEYGAIDDDIVMDDDDEIFQYNSMFFDSETDEEELKKNPKKRKLGKD